MLDPIFGIAIATLWLSWLIYWWVSARSVKANRWREPLGSQLLHRVPLMLAAILLGAPGWLPAPLTRRFLPPGPLVPALGVALLAAGLGFSVWARRHLGENWSSHVAVKEDHALIRSGPYGHLRHPIYTGLLLAFAGTGLAIGEWRAVLALPLALVAFAWKSRREEQQMRRLFPEYERYRRETAALIPFVY
ncbi:MAG TPA: isoprenylcysteine carboxylmethyltransferase family protein [Gemmatimonadales bacterium]|jgi:protein-S-isoprenylcysteine O-methyltransferase Ste14